MQPAVAPDFLEVASAAFYGVDWLEVERAATILSPFVDLGYRIKPMESVVFNRTLKIPYRLHFHGLEEGKLDASDRSWLAIQCLCTRSTDGYMRQASLRHVLQSAEPWTIPFVVLPAGEYVVEIAEDLASSLSKLDRNACTLFVRENRPLLRRLRSRATRYWDLYHRGRYPNRNGYPGLVFLYQLEAWAS